MVNLMRRYQQTLMIVITFIVIIAFAWLYNDHDFAKAGNDHVGAVYGRTVSRAEYLRVARKFEICQMLGMQELWSALGFSGNPKSRNDLEENFIWNSFVLRHEADALAIEPTEAEIVDAVQKIPAFETNGVYDSSKYAQFVQQGLTPRGLGTDQLEEIIGDSLRLQKIKTLLGATNDPVPSEVRALFERRNQKTELSVIRLKLEDFKKEVKVSDEDLQKRFEERKDTLQHPEKRKVKFVAFTLPPAEPPLAGKERVLAMQKLSDQAGEFAVAMAEKGAKLEEVAAKFAVKVQESPEFEVADPPAELGHSEPVAQAAFQLTNEAPNSDAIIADNGYYVVQLAGITPARPMTFEEAKKQLTEEMINERANEALTLKATELRNKISEAIKGGKSFADAAKEAGANAEAFPVFSQAEPKMDAPDAREVMQRAAELSEGQISEFTPTATGGLLLHIDKRLPVDETNFEKEKPMIAQSIDRTKKEAAFQLWLKERRAAAGLLDSLRG
jgi:peptidyl-prolyl cis-trans isomerase D